MLFRQLGYLLLDGGPIRSGKTTFLIEICSLASVV